MTAITCTRKGSHNGHTVLGGGHCPGIDFPRDFVLPAVEYPQTIEERETARRQRAAVRCAEVHRLLAESDPEFRDLAVKLVTMEHSHA